ncbi:uncharacterized protein AMSG_06461 [Thecamonas trahens ATCC 50062]|uniref:NodB homology domain-containing protein n=1 Tax=Thecamonas trahens ATCC 50062 TaxID=461836 RepID=A0A0L0DG08_THETB|nr:hypothetical protein AMSG_06461 [Thecamonas trahens ATCC 50062]KNC51115.1 hypothetical protein AMSG_06461 [Thecamonas trahens ATCC 50062]|eukprot:XP_013756323.1 hypothetical protein AMSG_06461 [Thecamonas trahens ATCC 50062]
MLLLRTSTLRKMMYVLAVAVAMVTLYSIATSPMATGRNRRQALLRQVMVKARAAVFDVALTKECGKVDEKVEELVAGRRQELKKLGGKHMVGLSFDDFWLSEWLDDLLPVLDSAGAKATFFVPTSRIAAASKIELDMLDALVEAGHEIGHHSHTHGNAAEFVNGPAYASLLREYLLGELRPSLNFAYPYGATHEILDASLLPSFGLLRTTDGPLLDDMPSATDIDAAIPLRDAAGAVGALGLDEPVSEVVVNTLFADLAALDEPHVLLFYGHRTSPQARLHVELSKLHRIIAHGRALGLEFVTFADIYLARSLRTRPTVQ